MNLERCIQILTEHNKWRRGVAPYDGMPPNKMPEATPKELGEAIDFAINKLSVDTNE